MRVIFLLMYFTVFAFSDSETRPYSYDIKSENNKYLFVMRCSGLKNSNYTESDKHKIYPSSGAYKNNGSVKPLWTINWYASVTGISNDGQYIIRLGPWARSFDELGVAFYKRGIVIKEYSVKSLVYDDNKVEYSAGHLVWRDLTSYDKMTQILTIKTLGGITYKFSIDGNIISKTNPRLYLILFGTSSRRFISIIAIVFVVLLLIQNLVVVITLSRDIEEQ
ncbi:hypothetical protein [Candidatus Uabimicrobium sp. HlEnr_7]|uniref:hypothetical protein n=1 Tax=Candidatus Uabimicrobium helgolandensis TaxID=3095367 RepID=UPI003556F37C